MPEVVRGSRSLDISRINDFSNPGSPVSPSGPRGRVSFAQDVPSSPLTQTANLLSPTDSATSQSRSRHRREDRERVKRREEDAYYDSRAATKLEFKRRASTLQEYYKDHPQLLPQLPFSMHHGWRRWKLAILITIAVIDACVVPLVLYYGLAYGGNVQGWIIFAIVTTVWGGPTYVEFATRSFRLIKKKQNFYRPLGTTSRWCFDSSHYVFILMITAVTALFIVGSAPHIVWLRVLSMPGPAILYCLGGPIFFETMWSMAGRPAPFRLSSTNKGEKVKPGVYYFIEDIVSVNGNAGRPFREALAARYEASPIFRRMILHQSLFWSVPALVIAIVLTVVICIHTVSDPVAYGVGWAVPFIWAGIWVPITVLWVRREMCEETDGWELDNGVVPSDKNTLGMPDDPELANGTVPSETTTAADIDPTVPMGPVSVDKDTQSAEKDLQEPNGRAPLHIDTAGADKAPDTAV